MQSSHLAKDNHVHPHVVVDGALDSAQRDHEGQASSTGTAGAAGVKECVSLPRVGQPCPELLLIA
eukprot:8653422-Pyramimonas_sp.AAC.1